MTLKDQLKERLAFDEMDVHRQALLMGYDSNNPREHKAFEYGAKSEASRVRLLHHLLLDAVEAMQLSIARADDYADSHLSQPIRGALAALQKEIERGK